MYRNFNTDDGFRYGKLSVWGRNGKITGAGYNGEPFDLNSVESALLEYIKWRLSLNKYE